MSRHAFKMKIRPGLEEEYKKRHDEIWPELKELLKRYGIGNYSIFLEESTNDLFAILDIPDPQKLDNLRQEEVMKRWWNYMADISITNEDLSPVTIPLKEVFYLP